MKNIPVLFLVSLLLGSCSNKYLAYKKNYNFISKNGRPDYTDLNYWAAHPWKKDPSDSVPLPLINKQREDSVVDVFLFTLLLIPSRKKTRTPLLMMLY